jgi:heme-degrading monooxygenase HmoA
MSGLNEGRELGSAPSTCFHGFSFAGESRPESFHQRAKNIAPSYLIAQRMHPMIVTVFRSRVRPEMKEEYMQLAARMGTLAKEIPGYISHKGFAAADGEQVTIVEFESEEAQRVWSVHAEHVKAKKKGRRDFYVEYRALVCSVLREIAYPKK